MSDPAMHAPKGMQGDLAARKLWRAGTLTYTTGGLVALFCWLFLGDFSWAMRDRSVGPIASWYLSQIGVPNLVFALLLSSFPALVNLVFVPIISVKSDRHRGKRGRRIPYLLITTPIAMFGMIGLAVSPLIAGWVHGHFPGQSEIVVATVCFAVFWAAFEFASLGGQAVFGGLINDVVPQPVLGRFHGVFRAISLLDGIIFNYWIMGLVPTHYTLILLSIGVFYGISFMWVCFKVKEGTYPPPPPPVQAEKPFMGWLIELRSYFRECFGNSYYLLLFAFMMCGWGALLPINAFAIPYANSLGIDMTRYGHSVALTYAISLGLAYFLGWLADLFHPLRLAMATLVLYALVAFWGGLYAATEKTFLVAYVLHGVISGAYLTGTASLAQRLFPRAKYAQFASAIGILSAPVFMVMAPVVGMVIDGSGGVFRHCFTIGGGVAVTGLGLSLFVHRRFMKLGGPKNYVAPLT